MPLTINNQFTYEAIKARISKNAAEIWNVPDVSRLDPLVTNLIDMYATELSRLARHTKSFESNIIPKISSVAAPLLFTSPTPAHTVVQCLPDGDSYFMHRYTMFGYKRQTTEYESGMSSFFENLYFSPLGSQTIYNAPIKYMASGFTLYQLDGGCNKTLVSNTVKTSHLPPNSVWLAIDVSQGLTHLNWLNLYFSWGGAYDEWLFQLMPLIEIYNDDQKLPHLEGLAYYHDENDSLKTGSMETPEMVYREKLQELRTIYSKQFRTIPNFPLNGNLAFYPATFKAHFLEEDLAELQKPLLWLRLVFPPYYTIPILQTLSVSTSAFPVCNMRFAQVSQHIKEGHGLLPLPIQKGEALVSMDINGVEGSKGGRYSFSTKQIKDLHTYSLHFLDDERFDIRNADDITAWLQELVKDEPLAFKQYGIDYITSAVDEITAKLHLAKLHSAGGGGNIAAYLNIYLNNKKDKVKAGYWLTQHKGANDLQRGKYLVQENGSGITAGSIIILAPTRGGKAKLGFDEREGALWLGVASGNRLVTSSDIQRYCKFRFGGLISHAEAEHGLIPSHHPKQGHIRCITITLFPNNKLLLTDTEWGWMCSDLLDNIKRLSPSNIHYKVVVK